MPIKPENRKRYPKDWFEKLQAILERAGNRCEWCGAPQYGVGSRINGTFLLLSGNQYLDNLEYTKSYAEARELADIYNAWGCEKYIVIVLTIAHVHDKNPEACDLDNLAALCQKCHLDHDRPDHVAARKAKSGQMELFDESSN